MIKQTLDLNLIPGRVLPRVNVSQYDKGTRTLEFTIYNGEILFDPTGYTAYIQGQKPDGHGFNYAANIEDQKISVDVVEQMTAVSGAVACEIVIKDGTDQIGTGNFILQVEAAALPDDATMSESDYSIIQKAVEDAQAAAEEAKEATANAPYIGQNGNWYVYDAQQQAFVDTGIEAEGPAGPTGPTGPTGNGIASITKTGTVGLVDTYTITYTDGTTTTFTVTNGQNGTGSGDMSKAVYDQNDNGVVDDAEKLGGYLPSHFAVNQAMTGATSSTAGSAGLVPAPAAGDQEKALFGDGTWKGIPASGHTIQNASGTDLTQRSKMQFKGGLKATDDSVNQKTVVDGAPAEITWAQYNALSPAEQAALEHTLVTDVPGADGTISADLMKKLWENPNPGDAFSAQTITLSSSDYDLLVFVYRDYAYGSNYQDSTVVEKGNSTILTFNSSNSTGGRFGSRIVNRVSDTSFSVAIAYASNAGTQTQYEDNYFCVPVAIYGIKKTVTVTFDALARDVSTSASKCMLSDGETSVSDVLEKGSVSVSANGSKTYATLLNELYALIDYSKLTQNSKLWIGNSAHSQGNYFAFTGIGSAYLTFSLVSTAQDNSKVNTFEVRLLSSGSYYHIANTSTSGTTFQDVSSSAAGGGSVIEVIF